MLRLSDDRLYGGGIQMQEEPTCAHCGGEIAGDWIEVDGEYMCPACMAKQVNEYLAEIKQVMKDITYDTQFQRIALIEALEQYTEKV